MTSSLKENKNLLVILNLNFFHQKFKAKSLNFLLQNIYVKLKVLKMTFKTNIKNICFYLKQLLRLILDTH